MYNNLRIITTARTLDAINKAAKDGYWPLVKPVIPSPAIKSKYAIYQNQTTGEIDVINDYRAENQTTGLTKWNQGDSYRLSSCEAIWNGKDLILQVRSVASEMIVG